MIYVSNKLLVKTCEFVESVVVKQLFEILNWFFSIKLRWSFSIILSLNREIIEITPRNNSCDTMSIYISNLPFPFATMIQVDLTFRKLCQNERVGLQFLVDRK